jgi:hypothetical protein
MEDKYCDIWRITLASGSTVHIAIQVKSKTSSPEDALAALRSMELYKSLVVKSLERVGGSDCFYFSSLEVRKAWSVVIHAT